jgi:phage gp46-like protein
MEGAMFDLRGLLAPFRRDKKRDFASGSGPDLLRAKVLQALLTEGAGPRSSGELPWRTSFGAGLHLLRHQRNDEVLAALARVYVRDALARWVPSAQLVALEVSQDEASLLLRLRVRERQTGVEVSVETTREVRR